MKRVFPLLFLVMMPAIARAAARVSSDSTCPSADVISQRLLGLLTAGGPETVTARVRMDGETMRVELATPGEANRERVVAVSGDCELRAEMAALVIASWLDAMPASPILAPTPPPLEPAPVALPPVAVSRREGVPLDAPATSAIRALIGAGLFGMADAQGASAGLMLEAVMPNLLGSFGWAAEASLSMPRELAVGQGIASYWRPTLALAATADLRWANWTLRPCAGAVLGVLVVSGRNYARDSGGATVTWGGGAGITVVRSWQNRELWIRFDASTWPQGRAVRSRVLPSGPDIEVGLSEWEARLGAGISWGVR